MRRAEGVCLWCCVYEGPLGLERRIEEREENFIYTVFPYLRIPHLSCIVPRLSNFVLSPQDWNPSFHFTSTCMCTDAERVTAV